MYHMMMRLLPSPHGRHGLSQCVKVGWLLVALVDCWQGSAMEKEIGVVGEEYKEVRDSKRCHLMLPPSVTMRTARVVSVCDGWLVAG